MIPYLVHLTQRILPGVMQEPPQRRNELRTYFLAALEPSGGFRGRKGNGDLYYSAFALRGLFLLGTLDDVNILNNIIPFLEREEQRESLSPAEILSWVFCATLINVVQNKEPSEEKVASLICRWESFRRSDGCYASSATSAFSSTYTTFLSAIFYELLGKPEAIEQISAEPILQRQRPDGGFVELQPLRYSGTNPTAAASALLTILEQPLSNKKDAIDFLQRSQLPDGGFQAHARIPVSDLLSSFSAFTALHDLGAADAVGYHTLRNFVTSLRSFDGGFYGLSGDEQSDVEYTFYGMALEAMLNKR